MLDMPPLPEYGTTVPPISKNIQGIPASPGSDSGRQDSGFRRRHACSATGHDCQVHGAHADIHQLLIPEAIVNDDIHQHLPPIGPKGNTLRKIIVKLPCLDWGGEFIDSPCQDAMGFILDIVPNGRGGKCCFKIDFGADFGIQVVPSEDCRPWYPPTASEEETNMLDMMVQFIQPHPFSSADILGKPSSRYEDVYEAHAANSVIEEGEAVPGHMRSAIQIGVPCQAAYIPNRHCSNEENINVSFTRRMSDYSRQSKTGLSETTTENVQSPCHPSTSLQSDPLWIIRNDICGGRGGRYATTDDGLSNGDSDAESSVPVMVILANLGCYTFGPLNKKESAFA
jgi:hypothetical protein